jgi:ring-1,2-phenylacetyl-CoA epoxidase subunit PaaD
MLATHRPSVEDVWSWLEEVTDPEIPVVSVVDLGIVRNVSWANEDEDAALIVAITPTYSGCPAMEVIADAIRIALAQHGIERVELQWKLSPAWTTDWLSEAGRTKLQGYGIAPPAHGEHPVDVSRLLQRLDPRISCPRCGSQEVALVSQFGSTPCKALYRCESCREPFDYFKSH